MPVTLKTHTYFVPFDDRNLWRLFEGKAACHDARHRTCAPLVSKVFVSAGADDTVLYYDHHEDGYDADPESPTLVLVCVDNVAIFDADNCPRRTASVRPCFLSLTGAPNRWWALAAGLATSVLVLSLALSKKWQARAGCGDARF